MKKIFALMFVFFVFGVLVCNNSFFEYLAKQKGCQNINFFCSQKIKTDLVLGTQKIAENIQETKNGAGFIYSVSPQNAEEVFKNLGGCYGFSVVFDGVEVLSVILAKMRVVKEENVSNIHNYYGVACGLPFFDFLGGNKVNVQVAVGPTRIVVGSPIILGDY